MSSPTKFFSLLLFLITNWAANAQSAANSAAFSVATNPAFFNGGDEQASSTFERRMCDDLSRAFNVSPDTKLAIDWAGFNAKGLLGLYYEIHAGPCWNLNPGAGCERAVKTKYIETSKSPSIVNIDHVEVSLKSLLCARYKGQSDFQIGISLEDAGYTYNTIEELYKFSFAELLSKGHIEITLRNRVTVIVSLLKKE